ncbi:MAG TPA: PCRF domain-containing protein, partial [Candidatus Defluviicoccus seviourii]|nr:PCRF domain-containing protein [Candidatus Defluviicoccus seviourii]
MTAQAEDPDLWQAPERAQAVMREKTKLEQKLERFDALARDFEEQTGLLELGEAEDDQQVIAEAEAAITTLHASLARIELETLLSGEADGNDCYLEVHAGAGGTEAQD